MHWLFFAALVYAVLALLVGAFVLCLVKAGKNADEAMERIFVAQRTSHPNQ